MKYILSFLFFISSYAISAQTAEEHYDKSITYSGDKDYKNALIEIGYALKADSLNCDYLLQKGNCHFSLHEIRDAYNLYTKIIFLNNIYPAALNQRGVLLYSIQKFDEAIIDFNEALRLEKKDTLKAAILLNRATAEMGFRDFQKAYDDLYQAYQIDSLNIGTLNNLAAVCDEVGKGDQTLKYLFRILKIDSTFIGAYENVGFKYQEMKDYKKAITYFDKVISLDSSEPLAYNNRSYNKLKLKDYKGAMEDVEKSIQLYPDNSYAYRNRALIYIELKHNDRVCQDLNRALELGFAKMYGDEVDNLKFRYCSQRKQ